MDHSPCSSFSFLFFLGHLVRTSNVLARTIIKFSKNNKRNFLPYLAVQRIIASGYFRPRVALFNATVRSRELRRNIPLSSKKSILQRFGRISRSTGSPLFSTINPRFLSYDRVTSPNSIAFYRVLYLMASRWR